VQADFWNPTRATLVAAGRETVIDGSFRVNGFEYQIEEAMGCIARGERESASMPLKETLANAAVMDEIRRQIGLRYSFE
jgi:hypothetical protein